MAITYRIKCPQCGNVTDIHGDQNCAKCGAALQSQNEGMLQLYRMGSPVGVAVGYGIYINGQPMGHLANAQSLFLPLPYGTYTVHFTCGMTRRCQDATVTLSPESPNAYVKAHIKMGFWTNTIFAEPATAEEMPKE